MVKDQQVMEILIEYDQNLIEKKIFCFFYYKIKFYSLIYLPMLKYCFRSAKDFFSLIPFDISVTDSLFDVSNLRLEFKKKSINSSNQFFYVYILSKKKKMENLH